MNKQQASLEDLQHIKKMMERSSRFISLSGLSGVMAGCCALIGSFFAFGFMQEHGGTSGIIKTYNQGFGMENLKSIAGSSLFITALITFMAALVTAFLFTYLRSRKDAVPIWGAASKRLIAAVAFPMLVGGVFLFRELQLGHYGLLAPGSLIFYGIALVHASKYTLGEIKYLGYCQVLLGIINCWMIGYGLYFWAFGFGILHIIYGIAMWYRHERNV